MTSMAMLEGIVAQIGVRMDELAVAQKKTEQSMDELAVAQKEAYSMLKELRKESGGLGHKLGQLTELVVVPGIRPKMNSFGHKFRFISANKKVKAGGKVVAEMDAFLHNGVEAMAVEVKTTLTPEDVNKHVSRLKTLRKHEAAAGLENKALYGAVVGLVVEKHARKLALEKGLYVVEIMDCPESLEVERPKRCGRW
ncbi:MAG: hypothetical protein LBH93_00550 [Chitinispirillales bacterium]|jgi:hypothetical protein|nr:hypothetical protein [Chitinispirillales bacterium]